MSFLGDAFSFWKEWKDNQIRLLVTVNPFVATDGRSGKVITVSNVGKRPLTILEVYLPVLDSDMKIRLNPEPSLNDRPLPCFISSGEVFRIHLPCGMDIFDDASLCGNIMVRTSLGQVIEGPSLFESNGDDAK